MVPIWEIRGLSGCRCLSRLLLICVLVIDGLPLGYHFIGMHALLHLEHGVRGHPVNLSHLFRTFLDCGAFRGALGATQDDRRRACAASSCSRWPGLRRATPPDRPGFASAALEAAYTIHYLHPSAAECSSDLPVGARQGASQPGLLPSQPVSLTTSGAQVSIHSGDAAKLDAEHPP